MSSSLGSQRTGQFSDDIVLNATIIDVLIVVTRRCRLQRTCSRRQTSIWLFRRCSLIPWPSCKPVLQQIKHAVESSLGEVHLRCPRQTIQSDPPAQVSALATD